MEDETHINAELFMVVRGEMMRWWIRLLRWRTIVLHFVVLLLLFLNWVWSRYLTYRQIQIIIWLLSSETWFFLLHSSWWINRLLQSNFYCFFILVRSQFIYVITCTFLENFKWLINWFVSFHVLSQFVRWIIAWALLFCGRVGFSRFTRAIRWTLWLTSL